jgi:tetratricopeptide (TPR) repeat protein
MKAAGMFASGGAAGPDAMGLDRLLATMPVLEMDSLVGAYKIGKLKNSWPFNQGDPSGGGPAIDSSTIQGRLAYGIAFGQLKWEDAMDTLYTYYAGEKDWVHAAKVVEALALEHPTEVALYDRTANIYGQLGDDENAVFYFRRSFAMAPSFDKARSVFVLYLKMDRPAEALPFLDYAIRNNVGGMNLAPVKQFAQEIMQLQETARKDGPTPALLNGIAAKYRAMGNKQGAALYIDSVLKMDPGNKVALSFKGH